MTPTDEQNLGERQAAILRAIVREYIRTGEPVGSKYLVDRTKIQASSATVRNDMSRLEELGFVAQPHTSAGRIPTDQGYRFVVDEIKQPRALAEGQQRVLQHELGETDSVDLSDLLHRASDVVARFTHHAAAVLARRERPSVLRHIELFPSGSRLATLVVIAGNGRIEQRLVPFDSSISEAELEALGRGLSQELHGSDLSDAVRSLDQRIKASPERERGVLEQVGASLQALLDSEERMVVGGAANLAGGDDFERETLQGLFEALEQQTTVLELLTSALGPVTVRIGSELPRADFRSCSIVVANFGPDGARGSVGVIGPTRMDYDRAIATANAVARILEGTLGNTER